MRKKGKYIICVVDLDNDYYGGKSEDEWYFDMKLENGTKIIRNCISSRNAAVRAAEKIAKKLGIKIKIKKET